MQKNGCFSRRVSPPYRLTDSSPPRTCFSTDFQTQTCRDVLGSTSRPHGHVNRTDSTMSTEMPSEDRFFCPFTPAPPSFLNPRFIRPTRDGTDICQRKRFRPPHLTPSPRPPAPPRKPARCQKTQDRPGRGPTGAKRRSGAEVPLLSQPSVLSGQADPTRESVQHQPRPVPTATGRPPHRRPRAIRPAHTPLQLVCASSSEPLAEPRPSYNGRPSTDAAPNLFACPAAERPAAHPSWEPTSELERPGRVRTRPESSS
jgi:hypothetical protein